MAASKGPVTRADASAFDMEQGLLALPGDPARWIWAFTCPEPECGCRTATILSAEGNRASLVEKAWRVAATWQSDANFARATLDLPGVTSFSIDLDTRRIFPAVGDAPLDVGEHPEVGAIADRLDDDVLDTIARNWHRAKGEQPPTGPGASGGTIEVEDWQPGRPVFWHEVEPSLRRDTYTCGAHVYEALELYCVEPECDSSWAIVDFAPVAPRGAPSPGCVEFDGEDETIRPDHERHRGRLDELWAAYCARHRHYRERFAHRSVLMHALAGRIVAAPPRPKVGRNDPCPCGSGKKHKKCCGAT
jgi:hypothetical protein